MAVTGLCHNLGHWTSLRPPGLLARLGGSQGSCSRTFSSPSSSSHSQGLPRPLKQTRPGLAPLWEVTTLAQLLAPVPSSAECQAVATLPRRYCRDYRDSCGASRGRVKRELLLPHPRHFASSHPKGGISWCGMRSCGPRSVEGGWLLLQVWGCLRALLLPGL